jgi:predicted O-methyltransferase YrrM
MSTTTLLLSILIACVLASTACVLVLARRATRRRSALQDTILAQTWHTMSLLLCLQPKTPLPAAAGWALSPDLLAFLVRHIDVHRPNHIVELGSGLSTVILGLALKKTGGRLTSIESDGHYLQETRTLLDAEGLDNVKLLHIPLGEWQGHVWYEPERLESIKDIDVLLVDGPPGSIGKLARYPALPVFRPVLNKGAIVILDDTNRAAEKEITKRWIREYPDMTERPSSQLVRSSCISMPTN